MATEELIMWPCYVESLESVAFCGSAFVACSCVSRTKKRVLFRVSCFSASVTFNALFALFLWHLAEKRAGSEINIKQGISAQNRSCEAKNDNYGRENCWSIRWVYLRPNPFCGLVIKGYFRHPYSEPFPNPCFPRPQKGTLLCNLAHNLSRS